MDDEDSKLPYITDTIPNSPAAHQIPTQAKLNVWIKYISMEKILSHLNVHLMNSIAIKTLVGNPSSSLVYAKGRAIIEQILKRFDIYLKPQV